jgi:NAD(P)H dehydrogenase (quinone)
MKILIILAHPEKNSFNHAIAYSAEEELRANGYETIFHDLYDEGFDPILPAKEISSDASLPEGIAKHCREIVSIAGIIIVHPNWWGQPPAILKGWVDRVIRPGVAYEFLVGDNGEGIPHGLLKGTSVVVFNTSNTPDQRENAAFGDPLHLLWRNCIFDLCGAEKFRRRMFNVIVESTVEQRDSWLKEVREITRSAFPKSNQSPASKPLI